MSPHQAISLYFQVVAETGHAGRLYLLDPARHHFETDEVKAMEKLLRVS